MSDQELPSRLNLLGAQGSVDPLQLAVAHHQRGRLKQARALYQLVLDQSPQHFHALCLLGSIESALKDFEGAIGLFERALKVNSRCAAVHSHIGNAQLALRRFDAAKGSFDSAVTLEPADAAAWNNRGNSLFALERYEEASASYTRALTLKPDCAEVLFNDGNAQLELGRPGAALARFDQALSIRPNYAEALRNRGRALRDLRRIKEALGSFDSAVAARPAHAEALCDRGNALLELNRAEEALDSYAQALKANPELIESRYNRGVALAALGRHAEAAQEFASLLEVEPEFAFARGELLHSRLHCCDWSDYAQNLSQIVEATARGRPAATPFAFLSASDRPDQQLACAMLYAGRRIPAALPALWHGECYGHRKIRIAYLSADFHDHATAHLAAELFERHDAGRFETYAISFGPGHRDEWRARLERAFTRFLDVTQRSDHEAAQLIRELEIDIAVDLKGYTRDSRPRILAYRPAPVQVSYLGFPGSMGVAFMDYLLADPFIVPETQAGCYSEQIVRLPHCYQPNASTRPIATPGLTREDAGLPEGGFVFCSFVAAYKITPPVFDCWMRLLAKIPGSVLWLLMCSKEASNNLRRAARSRGVDATRLVFAPRLRLDEHLARHCLADLFLDTLPINAHTTASDALQAGLPVVTQAGSTFAGRVAGSALRAVGLPDLITRSLEDYEVLALDLARDPLRLAAIRARLARNRTTHPLFDTDRLRRNIESAFATMVERSRGGNRPAPFFVSTAG